MLLLFTIAFTVNLVAGHYNISDDILFGINWPGDPAKPEFLPSHSVIVKTNDRESFRCSFPHNIRGKHDDNGKQPYKGPTELDLLKPLFNSPTCSYKIESYWTYELCHGKHLRQYHEEQVGTGKVAYTQEYFLGYYEKAPPDVPQTEKPPTITLEGNEYPYFEMNYTGGMVCDLTGEMRQTRLLHICHTLGRGEVYELTELQSCHYQAVVLSKQLCSHPRYLVVQTHVNDISCTPVGDGIDGVAVDPSHRPKALQQLELDAKESMRDFSTLDGLFGDSTINGMNIQVEASKEKNAVIYRIKTKESPLTETPTLKTPIGQSTDPSSDTGSGGGGIGGEARDPASTGGGAPPPRSSQQPSPPKTSKKEQEDLLKRFLDGQYCINGGSGWWKHEFCFRRNMIQYHDDVQTGRTVVVLGIWKEDEHLDYLKHHPEKKGTTPSSDRDVVYQFYGSGDYCEEAKRKRSTLVKIRCKVDVNSTVTILFQEPLMCQYIVTVESSIFCPLVRRTDENGIVVPDILD